MARYSFFTNWKMPIVIVECPLCQEDEFTFTPGLTKTEKEFSYVCDTCKLILSFTTPLGVYAPLGDDDTEDND